MADRRKGILLLVVGLVAGLLVAGYLIAKPVYEERAVQTQKAEKLQAESDRLLLDSGEQDALRTALPDEADRQEIRAAILSAARGAKVVALDVSVTPLRGGANGGRAALARATVVGTPAQVANLIRRLTATLQLRPGTKYAYATVPSPALTMEGMDIRALPGGARVRASLAVAAYQYTGK